MKYITDQMIVAAIDRMDPIFDTHAFIREILCHLPPEYAKDLGGIKGADPIRTLHGVIGKRLKSSPRVRPLGKVTSENIRSGPTPNEQWERI